MSRACGGSQIFSSGGEDWPVLVAALGDGGAQIFSGSEDWPVLAAARAGGESLSLEWPIGLCWAGAEKSCYWAQKMKQGKKTPFDQQLKRPSESKCYSYSPDFEETALRSRGEAGSR